jgi:hypothetical protein
MIAVIIVLAGLRVLPRPRAVPCWAVRKAVAQYGVAAVESWARAKGMSDREIEQAKRCLR